MSRRPFHNPEVSFTNQEEIYTERVKNSANWKLTKQEFRKTQTKFYPSILLRKYEGPGPKRNFKFKRDYKLRQT